MIARNIALDKEAAMEGTTPFTPRPRVCSIKFQSVQMWNATKCEL